MPCLPTVKKKGANFRSYISGIYVRRFCEMKFSEMILYIFCTYLIDFWKSGTNAITLDDDLLRFIVDFACGYGLLASRQTYISLLKPGLEPPSVLKDIFGTSMLTRYLFIFKDSSLNSDAKKWAKTVIHQLSQDTCINLVEGTEGNHEVTFIAGSG